tara:strand:- start:6528 stop:6779 length:252 start_codon:yes stop_codon:yes gene_type:complete
MKKNILIVILFVFVFAIPIIFFMNQEENKETQQPNPIETVVEDSRIEVVECKKYFSSRRICIIKVDGKEYLVSSEGGIVEIKE